MKVSIITAVYNREATIARTIRSVERQSHGDIEHLIIDGASRDRTREIVEDCASPLVTFLSEPDNGIYDALNKGIAAASGEVIGLLHSDDRFAHDQVLSTAARYFEDPSVDAVYGDAAFFSMQAPDRLTRRYNSGLFNPGRIQMGMMPAHTALFLRRGVFERFGLYKTDYRIAADFEFIARIFKDGALKSHYVSDIWVHMQTGGASTSGLASNLVILSENLRACRENGIPSSYFKILRKYPLKLSGYVVK